ncbi:MAG: folate family ECF transporter S component [Lachnospiraceae bacterium]|nr:folate family ECF transporter S component [Lachnospiraceae bacterium]
MNEKKSKSMVAPIIICLCAMMIALQFLFERYLSISTPFYRIGLTFITRAVTGLCVGTLLGGLCSWAADFIGSVFIYGSVNPFISVAALLRGLGFGYVYRKKEPNIVFTVLVVLFDQFICGTVITTIGLIMYNGMPNNWASWGGRAAQAAFLTAVEIPVLFALNKSVFPHLRAFLKRQGIYYRYDRKEKAVED